MRRIPWDIILALLTGLGLGLVYAWMIAPLRVTASDPLTLRADFKESYRSAIAAAYAASGNLPRAQARLSLLKDPDPIEALNAQAQRMMANSESFQQADEVAALAAALSGESESVPTPTRPTEVVSNIQSSSTATVPPPPPDEPLLFTETPQSIETQPTVITSTPRPTQTPLPTLGAPYTLTGQDSLCDSNLPDGLLQVIVLSANRRQLPGVKIMITWNGGEEQFFTGLKPELGNGYADYLMAPDITYTVQLAIGSNVASGLTAPTCQTPGGETFLGGIKLTFQQP
jgi:hypothetical protein